MPFKIYDTKEAVPADELDVYEEREVDGVKKWHAKVPDVSKMDSALEKERKARRDEEAARKTAEKERDELKRKQEAREKGISEEELQKIRDAEEKARKPIVDENEQLKAENRKLKLDDKARALALKAGVMPDRIEDAMVLLASRLDLSTDGNILIKDAAGAVTTQTADDFFSKTFKEEKKYLYAGPDSSGDNASGNQSKGAATGDQAKALDAAAAAGKAAGESARKSIENNALAFR